MRLTRTVDPLAGTPALPDGGIERILILRTAPVPDVERVHAELVRRYPGAAVGVLGSRLEAAGAFHGCLRFEIADGWLTPASVAPLSKALAAFAPDLVVLCLNNDWRVGYERVSRVVRGLRAPHTVVAGCNGTWAPWRHAEFTEGHPLVRWLGNAVGMVLLTPAIALYLLVKPGRPLYAATPPHKPRRETCA